MLGLIAMVMGAVSSFSCNTITIPQNMQAVEGGIRRGGSLNSGPFSYRSNQIVFLQNLNVGNTSQYAFDICRPYSLLDDFGHGWDQDSLTPAIRGFATIAITFGAIGLGGVLMVPCCGTTMCLWNCYGLLFALTSIFQGLCLTITRSTLCTDNPVLQILADSSRSSALRDTFAEGCEVYVGYTCGIVATILWLIGGLVIVMVPAPEKWQDDWCSEGGDIPVTDVEAKLGSPTAEQCIER
jgi:hypothetical protein